MTQYNIYGQKVQNPLKNPLGLQKLPGVLARKRDVDYLDIEDLMFSQKYAVKPKIITWDISIYQHQDSRVFMINKAKRCIFRRLL